MGDTPNLNYSTEEKGWQVQLDFTTPFRALFLSVHEPVTSSVPKSLTQ